MRLAPVRFVTQDAPPPYVVDAIPAIYVGKKGTTYERAPRTYGQRILDAWDYQGAPDYLVVVEQDIAIDPRHLRELKNAADQGPIGVYAVPYVLWPASTGRDRPCWAHRRKKLFDEWEYVSALDDCPREPAAVGLGCTALPARLLEAMAPMAEEIDYPTADTCVSALATEMGLPLRCTVTEAVHCHWRM